MSKTSFEKLKEHLKEMFHYNENDLDFGVFKLIKLKRKEIATFLEGNNKYSLKYIVDETLEEIKDQKYISEKLIIKNFIEEKGGTDEQLLLNNISKNYSEIKQFIQYKDPDNELGILTSLEYIKQNIHSNIKNDLEDKIYNYILNFFLNYYNNGDFGYNSKAVSEYKVDFESGYDGSDKLFYWKNKGNIYIKSAEGFSNLKFKILDKKIEFRLNNTDSEVNISHNNNKDSQVKHYEYTGVDRVSDTYTVNFNLSKTSTSKDIIFKEILTEIFRETTDLNPYLYKNDKKKSLIFNNLSGSYDKIQNGQMQGVTKLYISQDKYLTELVKHDEFKELGSNNNNRKEKLKDDELANIIFNLDKNLNKFYVGNDADYFLHEDLGGFLTSEKEKYIKNIIFSDLDQIFEANLDNTTLIIARAFNKVTDNIIEFLAAIENFQKNIFQMRKKVLSTNYLITLDKIPSQHYSDILKESKLLQEFKDLHKVKVNSIADLEINNHLAIDTKNIENMDLKYQIISTFNDLEQDTDALLINSENYQGLNLMRNKYYQKVKCIYIDPPYNTGGDFIYKDSFKHSTWLTFMESRLSLAKDLLDKEGSIFVSIDDEEVFNLKLLMDEIFGESAFVASIAYERSGSAGLGQGGAIVNTKEYILFYSLNKTNLNLVGYDRPLEKETMQRYSSVLVDEGDKELIHEFKSLSNDLPVKIYKHTNFVRENISLREFSKRESEIRKEYAEKLNQIYRTNNVQKENQFQNHLISFMNKENLYTVDYTPSRGKDKGKEITRYYYNAELFAWLKDTASKTKNGVIKTNKITDMWGHSEIPKADLANEGGVYLSRGKKPENLLYRLIKLATNEGDIVLDFFAGSASTAATALKMKRKSIAIEMGEYFEAKTLTRMKNVLSGDPTGISKKMNWSGGGIVKYHEIEQYEDILMNLNVDEGREEIPQELPKKYLFRPEANHIRNNFDLSKPFTNNYVHGKSNKSKRIDFMETYCYLKGYQIESNTFTKIDNKSYQIVKSGNKLIIFREIELGEDDSSAINEITARYENVDSIEINFEVDVRRIQKELFIINNSDFDEGLLWS